jgi:hypothetical protein
MHRFHVLMAVMSLSLVVSAGHALADGPSAGSGGEKVAQVSFIDRALNLIQLSDGMELRAPDQRMLANLKIGEWVKVDFVSDGDRVMINSIEPAPADEIPGPVPTAVGGGITNHS